MTIYRIGITTGGDVSPTPEAGAPDAKAAVSKTAARRRQTSASTPGVFAERPPKAYGEGKNRPRLALASLCAVAAPVSATATFVLASAVTEKVIKQVESGGVSLSGRHSVAAIAAAAHVGALGLLALKTT